MRSLELRVPLALADVGDTASLRPTLAVAEASRAGFQGRKELDSNVVASQCDLDTVRDGMT